MTKNISTFHRIHVKMSNDSQFSRTLPIMLQLRVHIVTMREMYGMHIKCDKRQNIISKFATQTFELV